MFYEDEQPILDVNKMHTAKLIDTFRQEDVSTIYFTFETCEQTPRIITGSCLQDLSKDSELSRWLATMNGTGLGIEEIGFLEGSIVELTINATTVDGKNKYFVRDILKLVDKQPAPSISHKPKDLDAQGMR
jgi:hypothetical protein